MRKKAMNKDGFNYGEYLASREWALLKEQVRKRSSGFCERCSVRPYQDTHHLTYERIGNEELDDLLAVCRPCHEYLSGKRKDDPWIRPEPDEKLLKMRANFIRALFESGWMTEDHISTDKLLDFLVTVGCMPKKVIMHLALVKLACECIHGKGSTLLSVNSILGEED
jgi:hypothetical protein